METKKRYWLRGLIIGTIVYVSSVLIMLVCFGGYSNGWGITIGLLFAMYFWPVIIVGLLVGWIWGDIKIMNPKRYWLRGLVTGVVIYLVGIVFMTLMNVGNAWGGLGTLLAVVYFWPVIIIGLLIGWILGRFKKPLQA